ncbi:PREDICTED: uncharacterized protein LOC109234797 [Nicotiana attenuata]|uniref:uncharacterized protein LOC109234797 n=1 Tax=Nicotiana attenuata TaxID=49451 RepID=UPI000904C331|nr:PREDICTED: uncharacterized protein LOC109234797 [Nicotiana attenuata]
MQKEHGFFIVALMEPKQKQKFFQKYRRRLGMEAVISNVNEKIWLFFDAVVEWDLLIDTEQQMTIRVYHQELVGGDFNVVMGEEEKIGGLPVYPPEYEDFAFCANSCGLFDLGYKGSPFTWWNGSDHAPLLMSCGEEAMKFVKPFKFLNFWTKHEAFLEVVKQNWIADFIGDPFLMFKQKLKRVKIALSKWSKVTHGDIYKQLAIREDVARIKEMLFEEDPSSENRIVLQQAQAELKKYLNIEEQYWKQKAGMTWFEEGDRNTSDGAWIEDQNKLSEAAIEFFQKQFTNEGDSTSFELLNNVPTMVTREQNMELCRLPTEKEVKDAVFALSSESASAPDGFSGLFFQVCWDIVGLDIHSLLVLFFEGSPLPKSITHTNLVLLPKKPQVQTFSDLRPISLSNFVNKIFSRVVHDRLEKILPSLISLNQFGFVKGRSIFENILLTQEIVTDIRLRGKPANVVIKLDMAKAYDRVSWKYLMHVLRKMGFGECFINMVWNLISNNWYSVMVNGQASGFFHSTRGVKQGDPLSPALFILSAEVLSRSLNKLYDDRQFRGFGMPKWSDPLNHLAYVDDTIIFASADPYSLQKIVDVLALYERTSGQLINKAKSSYYVHSKIAADLKNAVATFTGFSKGTFPFTYLGCPIFYTRRRKNYYNDLIQKVKAKLHSWKGKLLSYGGKATLISSVLQSIPTHILSVLDPPDNVIEHLHKIFTRFFWSNKEEGRSRHWTKWQNLCLPKEEGGIGFRSLFDVSKAVFAKLWWRFRTSKSLWSNFMWNKYCKKELPTVVQFREGSHVWRKMLEARDEVEHEILWEMNRGSTNIWHENWTGLGALYHVLPPDFHINEELQEVSELRGEGQWNDAMLDQTFPLEIADHIREEVHFAATDEYWVTPRWMPTPSGKFTVSSGWKILRHREPSNSDYAKLWTKGLPFKISFFFWRVWKGKFPTDDIWRGGGYMVVSKCWCCLPPKENSFQHLFLTSDTAKKVWSTFSQAAGLVVNMVQVHQVIKEWWNAKYCPKLKPLFQAAPAVILWEIWKRRNTIKHGGSVSCSRVIHEVNKTLYYLAKVRYPWLPGIPLLWPEMIRFFEQYKPVIVTRRVTWQLSYEGWFKCNTDGASRGNPGPSSYGFCVRDHRGDLIDARAREIGDTTNIVAEAIMETDSLVLLTFNHFKNYHLKEER